MVGQCRPREDCTGTVTYNVKLIVPDPANPSQTIEIDPAIVGQPNTMNVEFVVNGVSVTNPLLRLATGFTGMVVDPGSAVICELTRIQ